MPDNLTYARSIALNALIPFVMVLSCEAALADTKKVDVEKNKAKWIDGIARISGDTCGSMLATPNIKTQAKNGRIEITMAEHEVTEGPCKGHKVKFLAVGYAPKRNFTGKDSAEITYRSPNGNYYMGQDMRPQSVIYDITVK